MTETNIEKNTNDSLLNKIGRILFYSFIIFGLIFITGRHFENKANLRGPIITTADIRPLTLKNSLNLTLKWYKNNIDAQTHTFKYEYDPIKEKYSSENNHIRQLATAWSISNVEMYVNSKVPENFINPFIDYYMKSIQYKDNYAFIQLSNKDASLAYNAFLIQILLNSSYPNKDALMTSLANGILALQQSNGSYNTNFIPTKKQKGIDYYPGEAMLALANLYKYTKNEAYMDSIQRAFPFYKTYWRAHKSTAFVPWQTQAYVALYEKTNQPELAEFVIEMNNWLIELQYTTGDNYKIGGFGPLEPNSASSVYLEGIHDAYTMLLKMNNQILAEKYKTSLILGTRYVLQTQYTTKNTPFPNANIILGGFRGGITRYEVRIDMAQHGTIAVMKALKNKIFE